jgi:tetratricopeptide (TPR) repeat protein
MKNMFLLLSFFLLWSGAGREVFSQNRTIDSLITLIKKDKEDTTKVNHMNTLGREIMYQNPDSAIVLGNEALRIITQILSSELHSGKEKKANIMSIHANTLSNLGVYFYYKADNTSALNYFLNALKIDKEIKNKKGITTRLGNIGLIYHQQSNFSKALEYYFTALKMADELGDKQKQGINLSNIGNVYLNQLDYHKALDYYLKALEIDKQLGNKMEMAMDFGSIGIVYQQEADYPKALDYYFRALKINEELGNKSSMAIATGNIGVVYYNQKNYPKALDYHLKALKMDEELENKNGIARHLSNIGSLYMNTGKYKEAEQCLKKAIAIDSTIGAMDNIRYCEEMLSQLYDTTGRCKEALIHYRKAITLKDTIYSQENKKQLVRKEMNYEFEKKEAVTKAEYDKQQAIAEEKNRKQKIIIWSIAAGLLLVIGFAVFVARTLRITNKQKKIIESQKLQIVESINYSKKIQDSLLPSITSIQQAIPGIFVFFDPKDIVSGDFYYFKTFEKYTLLACVDCTGHGVPGGFMSTLGSLLLDKIVNSESLSPSEILKRLNDEIIRVLHQQDGGEIQDGMDLSICLIDHHNRQIEFSGARNGIIIVSGDEVKRYKADLLPVGGNYLKKGGAVDRKFKTQNITIHSNDWVYMYTDGFMEQVGGTEGIPMSYSQFEDHLKSISNKNTTEVKTELLQTTFETWKGRYERDDDILIVGFQIV